MIKISSTDFENVVNKFIKSPEFENLEIGEFVEYDSVRKFERKYSVLAVYDIKGTLASKRIYIKIERNFHNKPEEEFNKGIENDFMTNLFWYKNFAEFEHYSTFKPLFYSIKDKCIITEECNGESLISLLENKLWGWPKKESINLLLNHMSRFGKLMKVFQNYMTL